jgi:hypothetical protein
MSTPRAARPPARGKRFAVTPLRDLAWQAVAHEMSAHGFRIAESSLRRVRSPAIQVAHLRYRTDRRSRSVRFTIDLGVFFPQAYSKIRSLRDRKTPRPGTHDCMCTVRCNVGALLGPAMTEHWWTVRPESTLEETRESVSDAVQNAAVPWLDRFSNPRHAMDETDRLDAIALSLMLGDLDTARRLTQLAQIESPLSDKLHEWARRRWLVP